MSSNAVLDLVQSLAQQAQNEAHIQRIKRRIWRDPNCSIRAIWNALALQTEQFHVISSDSFASFFQRHPVDYQHFETGLLIRRWQARYGIQSGTYSERIDLSSFLDVMKPIFDGVPVATEVCHSNTPIIWLLLLSAVEIKYESEWQRFLSFVNYKYGLNTEQLFHLVGSNDCKGLSEDRLQTLFRQHGYLLDREQLLCLFHFFGAFPSMIITLEKWNRRFCFPVTGSKLQPLMADLETLASIETIERIWLKYFDAKTRREPHQQQQQQQQQQGIDHSVILPLLIGDKDVATTSTPSPFEQTAVTGHEPSTIPTAGQHDTNPLNQSNQSMPNFQPREKRVQLVPADMSFPANNLEDSGTLNSTITDYENVSPNVNRSSATEMYIDLKRSDPMHAPSFCCKASHCSNSIAGRWPSSLTCNYCLNYPADGNTVMESPNRIHNDAFSGTSVQEDLTDMLESEPDNSSTEETSITQMELRQHSTECSYKGSDVVSDESVSVATGSTVDLRCVSNSEALLTFLRSLAGIAQQLFNLKRKLSEKPGFSIDAVFRVLQKTQIDGDPNASSIMALSQRHSINAEVKHSDLLIAALSRGSNHLSRSCLQEFFNGFDVRRPGILKEYHVAIFLRNLSSVVAVSERLKMSFLTQDVSLMRMFEVVQRNGVITSDPPHGSSPQIEGLTYLIGEFGSLGQMQFSEFCSMLLPYRFIQNKGDFIL